MIILGFDPGRDKCGLAVMESGDKGWGSPLAPLNKGGKEKGGKEKGGKEKGRKEKGKKILLYNQVVIAEEVLDKISSLIAEFSVDLVVMGDQTTAKFWQKKLEQIIPKSFRIVLVDERNSSLEARDRYWQMYPPQGLSKLIPQGMRLPPRPVDDIVAILLIERYLLTVFGC